MKNHRLADNEHERWLALRTEGGAPLEHGWHLLTAAAGSRSSWTADGVRVAGTRDEQPISTVGSERGGSAVFLLGQQSESVEVRVGGDVPDASELKVRKVGRVRALFAMVVAIGDAKGAFGGVKAAAGFVRSTVLYGVAAAGQELLQRYRCGVDRPGRSWALQGWELRPWRPWKRAARLLLWPGSQLSATLPGDGPVVWEATGSDPQFALTRMGGQAQVLEAGWYRFRLKVDVRSGTVAAPCFYVRYANSPEHVAPAQLPIDEPDSDGRIDMLMRFNYAVRELRFDPSVRPASLVLQDGRLDALGRVKWPLHILLRVLRDDSHGGARRFARVVAVALSLALRGRFGQIGGFLAATYLRLGNDLASYEAWVRRYDTIDASTLAAMHARGAELAVNGPLISIIVPVYRTPEAWLRRCIDSVLAQAYPSWEMCIADDASPDKAVRELLVEYERKDRRIRVAYRKRNGHISEASNSALEMARGDYVALLDHDDELRPHALLEVVETLRARPDLEFVYSDEDKIDEKGRRFQPNFKPDWNPDLLLSQNYVCHFTVIRTGLVRRVGGFRLGYEGSQDHDLFLRCTAGLDPGRIFHIPKVLYHWRAVSGSTALERHAKDYASSAGGRAVADHVGAIDPRARVEELSHGHFRVRWPLPDPAPKVSVIVPTRDRAELLQTCVESVLARTRYPDFELVIVDNGSTQPEALAFLDTLRSHERVKVLSYDAPFNFSAINNWAVRQCDGEVLCLLNNDIEVVSEGWLEEMAALALREDTGAVGAMLYYPDGSIQHAGVILGLGGVANHAYCGEPAGHAGHGARALVVQNLSAVTAACLVIRRQVYDQVGGLDERLQVAFNDIDFCLRVREAGYRNVWTPFAELYHHESASRGREDSQEKVRRFHQEVALMTSRWGGALEWDPAYNPNLSLRIEDTSSQLAFPPRVSLKVAAVTTALGQDRRHGDSDRR